MFENKVLNCITKYNMISNGDKIVVAVSGGPDSIALLNVLINLKSKLNIELFVAHVNHMIRAVADEETEYVKEFCKSRNVSCFIKKVDVLRIAEEEKISTEEAGRNERYKFFDEVYNQVAANKIAIAHNKNDNAETVLMNIIRGTGTSGLKGIEPVRDNKFIRPLIETERQDIEKYCEENLLNPRIDESNSENIYTRNKIRNLLIPYIKKEFNPNIVESISRLSDLATQENNYVENMLKQTYKQVLIEEGIDCIVLNLKLFNKQDYYMRSRILLQAIQELFGTTKGIEKVHIEDLIKLCERNIGNKFLMPNKNTKIEVGRGKIMISIT